MRKFYEIYPIWSAVPTELSWSHFQELIRVDRKEEREFYESEAIKSNWGYRELGRQINTKLYDRYLISPDKNKILLESKKGLIERQPEELLKTPYIFEFVGLKENKNYLETDLEKALLSHLTEFLLELGRGFSFVASQQRLKIGSEYYYPDLVFYNRLAKCFVIIDLKIGKLTHQDIGQMQMYVNYYKKTQMIEGENEPIGILLCADKDEAVVEMTLGDNVKNVYASKYLTYLPSKEELIKIIKDEKELIELAQNNKNVLTPSLYKLSKENTDNEDLIRTKKWNAEIVNRILRNETYIGTLIQNIKTKPNYRVDKLIDVSKDEWIITENHHEPIISKDKFDEVQQILNRKTKVNKNDDIDLFSGYLKCSHCGNSLIIKKSKNQVYYYCSFYIKDKSCLKYSINKKKLEQMVKDEIIKKINIEQLDRKTLNELIDMIYIIDKNNIKIEFKNI